MTHVVAQPCSGCRYTDCVVVCPVECFYEGEKMLYIHPEECIDCEACVPECPVEAIFHEDNLPEEWSDYLELNAEMAEKCEVITEQKTPLADRPSCVGSPMEHKSATRPGDMSHRMRSFCVRFLKFFRDFSGNCPGSPAL